jgi:hypothetical protein
LGQGEGRGHLRRLGLQLGEWGHLVLSQPLWPPQDQPGRATGREVAGCRLRHHGPWLPRRSVWPGLAQTRRITSHGRVAPSIPTRLEFPAEAHGVTVPCVPGERRDRA